MSKAYLRVGNTWTELARPGDSDTYLINPTGVPVHVVATVDRRVENIDDADVVTVGGSVSQFHADKSRYVFAKANVVNDITVVVSDQSMTTEDTAIAQTDIDALAVQVMKLSERVTDNSLELIEHRVNHTVLLRKYIESIARQDATDVTLVQALAGINKRLIASELLFCKHLKDYKKVEYYLNTFESKSALATTVSKLKDDMAGALASISAISSTLDKLTSEGGNDDVLQAVDGKLKPVNDKLDLLAAESLSLHNALVRMSSTLSVEDIEREFAELLPAAPQSVQAVLAAIKNLLLELVALKTN